MPQTEYFLFGLFNSFQNFLKVLKIFLWAFSKRF